MANAGTKDLAAARRFMVDGQIRTNKVTNEALLEALSTLPRELFAPSGIKARAYVDTDLPLGNRRCMIEPMVLARLLQALHVQPGARVLVVGSNTGYGAALAGQLGAHVTALESDPALLESARTTLRNLSLAGTVEVIAGPLKDGYPKNAPYDGIVIEGSVGEVPQRLLDQLKEGGRLAAVERDEGIGRAVVMVRLGGTVSRSVMFDAGTARLPGFARVPAFTF